MSIQVLRKSFVFVVILMNISTLGIGQIRVPTEPALSLESTYSANVQPLFATFEISNNEGTGTVDVTLTYTATAVFSDATSTYWLTIPTALTYPNEPTRPMKNLQIEDSSATFEIVTAVNNFRGFYALIRENQPRPILPVSFGILLPPYHSQDVGLIHISEQIEGTVQKISSPFYEVQDAFRFPNTDLSGFQFETIEIITSSALGAPTFSRTVDPLTGEVSFVLVGMLLDVQLQSNNAPFSNVTILNAPATEKIFGLIPDTSE